MRSAFAPHVVSMSLALGVAGALGCSPDPEPRPEPEPVEATIRKNIEGQMIAILPFDTENRACAADPYEMDRTTFAACAQIDAAQLPEQLDITKYPTRFDPRQVSSILVVNGPPIDAAHPEVTWRAVVGLGPLPASTSDSSLVGTGGVHPSAAVLLLAPAAPYLVEGATALFAVTAAFFASRALVATQKVWQKEEAEPLIRETESLMLREKSCLEGIPTGHSTQKERDEYWQRCPNGTGAK